MLTADLLTPEEVAEQVRVDVKTVYRWLRSKKLAGTKAGRQWRVRRDQLAQFLESGANTEEASKG